MQNPLGGFAGVAADKDFFVGAGVIGKANDDGVDKIGCEFVCGLADAVGAKVFHLFPFVKFFNDVDCENGVFDGAAAGEIGERADETLDDRASDSPAAKVL